MDSLFELGELLAQSTEAKSLAWNSGEFRVTWVTRFTGEFTRILAMWWVGGKKENEGLSLSEPSRDLFEVSKLTDEKRSKETESSREREDPPNQSPSLLLLTLANAADATD